MNFKVLQFIILLTNWRTNTVFFINQLLRFETFHKKVNKQIALIKMYYKGCAGNGVLVEPLLSCDGHVSVVNSGSFHAQS